MNFPDLFSIFLDDPNKEIVKYLYGFMELRQLKLSKVNCDEIHVLLENLGSQLQKIEFVCLRQSLNLSLVASSCPQLQSLEVYYSMAVHVSSPLGFTFPLLQKLVIYNTNIHGFDTQQVIIPWVH